MSQSYRTGAISLIAAMVVWSGSYVAAKEALADFAPATLIALRFGIGFALMLPFALRRGFRFADVLSPKMLVFGFTGIVLHIGLETVGLMYTSAAAAALIVAANPATSAAMSVAFLGERLDRGRSIGIAASVVGTVLIAVTQVEGGGSNQLLGNLLVFAGVVAWGAFTVQGRRLGTTMPAIVSTTASAGSAILMLLPIVALELVFGGLPTVTPTGVLSILYLGAGASAAAYGLWNHALRHVEATTAAPFVNLVPVLGMGLAVLYGEPVAALQVIGGAVVIAGVWLGARDPARLVASPEPTGQRVTRLQRGGQALRRRLARAGRSA